MEFKVGDRVKYVGRPQVYCGVGEGIISKVDWKLPFPIIVDFLSDSGEVEGEGWPCLAKELELVK